MRRMSFIASCLLLCLSTATAVQAKQKILIVDGQNNHDWRSTTPILKHSLEESGLFQVDVATSPAKGMDMSGFRPKFSDYDAVLSNYNGDSWPQPTQKDLVDYVRRGGGLVIVHAANNSFGSWNEFNRMIGLGGWGGRTDAKGTYLRYREGRIVRDTSAGRVGSHGKQHDFQVVVRDPNHPITKGMPRAWMHAKDELYDRLRGPAENIHVLATAYSPKEQGGTGEHEPMIFTVSYGKGRVFHTPMGHSPRSIKCVGFIVTLLRGTEWAATGKVSPAELPGDFPTTNEVSLRE